MKKAVIACLGALSLLFAVCGLCQMGKEAPRYEKEQSALLFKLNEYRGAYNEYALSLSCGYDLAQEIATAAHATLDMQEGADFGTLRFEDRTAEQAIASGDLISYAPYLSPEFYLYPETVEGKFNDTYASENDKYLYSRIGLGDNGEVRSLTKGSTQKHTSRVVLIDTGIDYDHEEFVDKDGKPRISELSYSVGDKKTVKEGGWEIIDDNNSSHHGTMVAGSIFANSDNGAGVAGLAEDVELIVIKMPLTANGGYEINSFLSALDYCLTLENVDVVNMSLGFFYSENPFSSRISKLKQRGAVVVCAAGNEERSDTHYPSADPNVIGVGAFDNLLNVTGSNYKKASYSAFGDYNVNIVAPGRFRTTGYGDTYTVQQGTSLATPVVSAAVALYRSLYPESTPAEIINALYASADDQGVAGKDYTFGYGGLNIYAFLTGEEGSVTFDFGDSTQTSTFMTGTPLAEYPFPAKNSNGKFFGGWYLDAACTQPVKYYTTVFTSGTRLFAKWDSAETDGVFDYTFGDGGVYIRGYYGRAERLILPSSLNICGQNYPVVGISARAFQKTCVKELIVPNTVKYAEEYAFADNNFTYLYLPNSLTSVGKYAACNVGGTIYVGGTAASSVYKADWNVSASGTVKENSGAFTQENGMALIGDSSRTLLFYTGESSELSLVSEGGKITAVRDDALTGVAIKSLNMPDVTLVGARAFKNCNSLVQVNAPSLMLVGDSAFENCVALTELNFPQTLMSIGDSAFAGCTNLVRFTLEEGSMLMEIGNGAFMNCTALQSADLTQSALLTRVGSSAFENCKSLHLFVLPASVTTISAGALKGCENIVTVSVPFLGDGSTAKTHLGFIFGSSYSASQQVPKTLRYVFVTRENIAADALSGLSGLRILAKGRYLGTGNGNEIYASGNYVTLEIRAGGILCGLIGGAEGEALTAQTISAAYFTPTGFASLNGAPTTLTGGTVNLTYSTAQYTVSFYNGETLLSTKTYLYGERVEEPAAPVRPSTDQYNYYFESWSSPVTLAVKDAIYTAQFTQTLRSYKVYFYDADGTLLKVETCDYGTMPTPPSCADRYTDDAQFYDKFVGWGGEIATVTGEKEYTAVYEKTIRSYSITFRYDSADGEIIATNSVEYGALPVAPDTARPADSEYVYTFLKWEPEITSVTGEATYVAVYERTQRLYTVRFLDWNGAVLKTEQLHFGEMPTPPADPTRESDDENDYVFTGWGNLVAVAGDTDYTAQYRADSHYVTITFLTYNGAVIEEQRVLRGSEITPPQAPERPSNNPQNYRYEFDGWTPAIAVATVDAAYTARYKQIFIEYVIKFVDWDGTVLLESNLRYNESVTPPAAPTRAADERYSYEFAGWDSQVTVVNGDKTYTATYTTQAILYTVRFLDKEGVLIAEAQYEYGASVTPPAAPQVEGYEFVGWDSELAPVTGNAEYRAVYREIEDKPIPPHQDKEDNKEGGCAGCGAMSTGGGIMGGGVTLICIVMLAAVFAFARKKGGSKG